MPRAVTSTAVIPAAGGARIREFVLGGAWTGMIRLPAQHADEVVLNLASPFRVGGFVRR